MATFDGAPYLGICVHVEHVPSASDVMISAFFGLAGTLALHGGTRGRTLLVTGVLVGSTMDALNVAEEVWGGTQFNDGRVHTLVDDRGRVFQNLIYTGQFQPSAEGPKPYPNGWLLPFHISFQGLT